MIADEEQRPANGRRRRVVALDSSEWKFDQFLMSGALSRPGAVSLTSNMKVSTSSRMSRSLSTRPSRDASMSKSRNARRGFSARNNSVDYAFRCESVSFSLFHRAPTRNEDVVLAVRRHLLALERLTLRVLRLSFVNHLQSRLVFMNRTLNLIDFWITRSVNSCKIDRHLRCSTPSGNKRNSQSGWSHGINCLRWMMCASLVNSSHFKRHLIRARKEFVTVDADKRVNSLISVGIGWIGDTSRSHPNCYQWPCPIKNLKKSIRPRGKLMAVPNRTHLFIILRHCARGISRIFFFILINLNYLYIALTYAESLWLCALTWRPIAVSIGNEIWKNKEKKRVASTLLPQITSKVHSVT